MTNYLDPAVSGIKATIIDFGLSRLDMPMATPTPAQMPTRATWTELPVEVYDGKGEQWDVYRSMKGLFGEDWEGFKPISNVLVSRVLFWLGFSLLASLPACAVSKTSTRRKDLTCSIRCLGPRLSYLPADDQLTFSGYTTSRDISSPELNHSKSPNQQ